MEISIKEKRETYFTFYDVSKAYDNADNQDMLSVMWDGGLRGKTWRILNNLCTGLQARIKTQFGMTKIIDMASKAHALLEENSPKQWTR